MAIRNKMVHSLRHVSLEELDWLRKGIRSRILFEEGKRNRQISSGNNQAVCRLNESLEMGRKLLDMIAEAKYVAPGQQGRKRTRIS